VAYLIDGNNLIVYLFPAHLKDPGFRYGLVHKLRIFQRLKRTRIVLVFDGPPDPNLRTKVLMEQRFLVLYPDFGAKADHVIKERIKKETDLRRFYVVSSDREIKIFAKTEGAKALSCEEFSRLLVKSIKYYKKSLEDEKEELSLSPLEIEQWQKIFKDNDKDDE
jgi:predicted RNA-binding protein with PIN domain